MQKRFITYALSFFIPLVSFYAAIEYFTLQLPSSYKALASYMDSEDDRIEVLVLGSSQMKGGINPEFISQPTLNLAAGNQHHDTDFKLLQQLIDRFPNLETVVLETSYSHFELPHNAKRFWKNAVYLKYYGANNYERPTYFKDKILYLANQRFYSNRLIDYYIGKERAYGFNRYGYDTLNYPGLFEDLKYDEAEIARRKVFKINKIPSETIFRQNSALFFDMLHFLKRRGINVVLCEAPMYKTYLPQRVPEILARRDSIVAAALSQFSNVSLLSAETDTLHYTVHDYWNQSHLNPRGAEKFSKLLNQHLQGRTP